ncbi:MAG TPA: sugar ABC transporter permease [Chloroflexota bacterium]|nr:sugar ABC transporter permease [Chloroflexota bacterium]
MLKRRSPHWIRCFVRLSPHHERGPLVLSLSKDRFGTLWLKRRGLSLARQEELVAYLFILPSLIGFLAFLVVPMIASLGLSFYDWELLTPPRFIGVQNFITLLSDTVFRSVMLNTLYYTVGLVPLNLVISLGLAVWLNARLRGLTLYRMAFFMPVVTVTVAVALIWRWMYEPRAGVVDVFLRAIGLPGPAWLGDPDWAMPALILMSVWKGFGYNMVLFLAGLQGIPTSIYEAAMIDGATAWQRFWRITLPLLSPTVFLAVVLTVISSFQVFDQALVMTRGGPAGATNTIVLYIYQNGFEFFRMGYASAIAWVLFGIIFVFTLLQMRMQGRWVQYE